jgi:hypothetical protein
VVVALALGAAFALGAAAFFSVAFSVFFSAGFFSVVFFSALGSTFSFLGAAAGLASFTVPEAPVVGVSECPRQEIPLKNRGDDA